MDYISSEERTFREYTSAQAKVYAANRGSYHERLFDFILDNHRSSGGSFHTLLDVGCGPGNATRPLAKHFDAAFGVDPSPEMINAAKGLGADSGSAETADGERIDFVVGRAEDMAFLLDIGRKVDLLTSGNAAHWFDMPRFWASAARILNKGGTVALWTKGSAFCHPSTPNAAHVQEIIFRLKRQELRPYELPGNRLVRDCYDDLLLPWDIQPPIEGFSQGGFTRLDWDRDGHLSDGEHFFLGDEHVTLSQAEDQLSTASMVTRWRKEHPELIGTEDDIVRRMARDFRKVLRRDDFVIGNSCHLLLFKRD